MRDSRQTHLLRIARFAVPATHAAVARYVIVLFVVDNNAHTESNASAINCPSLWQTDAVDRACAVSSAILTASVTAGIGLITLRAATTVGAGSASVSASAVCLAMRCSFKQVISLNPDVRIAACWFRIERFFQLAQTPECSVHTCCYTSYSALYIRSLQVNVFAVRASIESWHYPLVWPASFKTFADLTFADCAVQL